MIHKPVLLKETIDVLVSNKNGTYLDGTVGFAGHSYLILNKISNNGRLIGLDSDPYTIEYSNIPYSLHHLSDESHNKGIPHTVVPFAFRRSCLGPVLPETI